MNKHLIYTLALCGLLVSGCKESFKDPTVWEYKSCDPSKPVEFNDFTPKEGGVRTRMYIIGSNFGTDETKISVTIGGDKAPVIASNGSKIHCMLTARAYSGTVNVVIKDKDGNVATDYTFDEVLKYQSRKVVGTLLRNVNPNTGEAPFQDGLFSEGAGLPYSDWMIIDPKPKDGDKIIYTCNFEGGSEGLRTINLTKKKISTLYSGSRSPFMQTFEFSADGDTIFIPDDNWNHTLGNVEKPNIWYALRSENFNKLRAYCYGAAAYSVAYMPDGTMFYTAWSNGSVIKLNRNTSAPPYMDRTAQVMCTMNQVSSDKERQIKMKAHPEGKYVIIFSRETGAIYKCSYNKNTQTLNSLVLHAGDYYSFGNEFNLQEGPGSQARFARPWGGDFAKNPKYVNRPDGDMYDFCFVDQRGQCMWNITPDGICSIIAGRSNYTIDGRYTGYIDGDPLHEARFNWPRACTYDPDEETYYIVDNGNQCVRYLRTE